MKPKPNVLLSITNRQTYMVQEVLECFSIWVVLYKGKPINIKTYHLVNQAKGIKYKKTSHSNYGHAASLARKLNILYKTTDFTVKEIKF